MYPEYGNDNDRTRAFELKKTVRRNDSIAWIVCGILLFFLNVISLGRITVVGQFLDDIVFTFTFGWFKYCLYLIFFGLNICIYFGVRFKFKCRFLAMVFATWSCLAWIISSILFVCAYHLNITDLKIDHYFSSNIFVNSLSAYVDNWKHYSVFGQYKATSWLISNPNTYFSLWAGGGFIGAFLSAIASYTTIYGNMVVALFALFIDGVWIMTGDALFLFKPVAKRRGRKLRILSLGNHAKREKKRAAKNKPMYGEGAAKKSIFDIQYIDDGYADLDDVYRSRDMADITIELPGFHRNSRLDNLDNDTDVIYNVVANRGAPASGMKQNYHSSAYNVPTNQTYVDDINFDPYLTDDQPQEMPHYQNLNNLTPQYPVSNQNWQQHGVSPNVVPESTMTDYPESKYGDVTPNEARKIFQRDTALTPFGANGKTMELLQGQTGGETVPGNDGVAKSTKRKIETVLDEKQMSIDDFMSEGQQLNKPVAAPEYDSPLKKRVQRNFNNNDYEWAGTRTLDPQTPNVVSPAKSLKCDMFINKAYRLPTLELLDPDADGSYEAIEQKLNQEAKNRAKTINDVFASFNVKASVQNYMIGPSVTKYIVSLEPGNKVQSVLNLENEIKLNLATRNVLMEAPINGMAAVGIEIPNSEVVPVKLRSIMSKVPFHMANTKLLMPIGKNVTGDVIFEDLSAMPHLLVAGSTGSGKSVMINSIIVSILMRAKPHEVKMLLIDPKRVELAAYANIPHLLAPVISDMSQAAGALKKVVIEMERRYALFQEAGVKNIAGFNKAMKREEEKTPFYVVIIDELADLMLAEKNDSVEESIMRLTQMARAAGIHMIIATQRPSTNVITGVIKANIPSRIAFAVANQFDSRTILDTNGAEKLIGKGDMLFVEPGQQRPMRSQGVYVSDDEISRITNFCSSQQEQVFEDFFIKEDDSATQMLSDDELDPLYEEAIDLIVKYKQASTSFLQRRLKIGYNRASRMIDQLEENGVIGPQNGAKSRDIYVGDN